MKSRTKWGLAAVLAIVGAIACGDVLTNVNVDTNQQNQTAPTPSPSASPAGSTTGPVASVTVNGMANGEVCPSGIQPAAQNRKVRVGCNLAITCNPRNPAGEVIFNETVTGTSPERFEVLPLGQQYVDVRNDAANAYNKYLTARAAGQVTAPCTVRGVSSQAGGHEFEVIP